MSNVGYGTWWPKQCPTVFRVQNITPAKCVRIFRYPIPAGKTRDLMDIPDVSEADIRHSLLKGELNMKIRCSEIRVVESNIDLLQFDECQKAFLEGAGVNNGLEVSGGGGTLDYLFREGIPLVGVTNGANRIFRVPVPDKFIDGVLDDNQFSINVFHNGNRRIKNVDFIVSESGGAGTGFDTVEFVSFTPDVKSKIIANYFVARP